MTVVDLDREWLIRAARGDVISDEALDTVRIMHLRADLADHDPELAAALTRGDILHADDQRRWPDKTPSWQPQIDIDVDTQTAFDELTQNQPLIYSNGYEDEHGQRYVALAPAAGIDPKRVRWTWDQRIAVGAIALLAGREGLGKSTVGYWMAAQLTRGQLAGEHHGQPKGVLICATEDSWAHTIVPRLMAHDADLHRVYKIEVVGHDNIDLGLSLPADLHQVADAAQDVDAGLLILDPLMSRLHASLDTHRDGEVRRALEPLSDMAEQTQLAILGLIHHNKSGGSDPLELVMGSKAFAAVARSVHTIVRDPDDDTELGRLFGTTKNNLGRSLDLPTLTFTIRPWTYPTDDGDGVTGQIAWGEERHESIADAIARGNRDPEEKSALDEACEWLEDYLDANGGTAEAGKIQAAGKVSGHNERTLRRARQKLKVEKVKVGYQGAWHWQLPKGTQERESVPFEGGEPADPNRTNRPETPQDPNLVPLAPLSSTSQQRGQGDQRGQRGLSPRARGPFEELPEPDIGPTRPCHRCPTGIATDISELCPGCLTNPGQLPPLDPKENF